jgi:hypothetical protein
VEGQSPSASDLQAAPESTADAALGAQKGSRSYGGMLTIVGLSAAAGAAAALLVAGALWVRARRRPSAQRAWGRSYGGAEPGFAPLVPGGGGGDGEGLARDCELAALAATISIDAEDVSLLPERQPLTPPGRPPRR